jgi:hypothetical protein
MDANTPPTQAIPDGNPIEDNPTQDSPTTDSPTTDSPTPDSASTPARPKGPNAAAIVVGLVAMVLAGLIIANETMGLQVDWSRLGPGGIVGIGLVLVVLGAIGLVRRHDDV